MSAAAEAVDRVFRGRCATLKIATVLFLTLIVRGWPRLKEASLWAEDGPIFFNQAYAKGLASLLIPYAGYFHTLPRLIALIGIQLPLVCLPFYTTLVCLFVFALVCAKFSAREFDHLVANRNTRLLICLGLTFAAGLNESLGNLANLHWFLAFYLALVGIRSLDAPLSAADKIFFPLILATSGEAFALSPLYVYRALKTRRRGDAASCLLMLAFAMANYFVREPARLNGNLGVFSSASTMLYVWINQFLLFPLLGDRLLQLVARNFDFAYWSLAVTGSFFYLRALLSGRGVASGQLRWLLACQLGTVFLMIIVRDYMITLFNHMVRDPGLSTQRFSTLPSLVAFFVMACLFYRATGIYGARAVALFAALWITTAASTRLIFAPYSAQRPRGMPHMAGWPMRVRGTHPDDCRGVVVMTIEPHDWNVNVPASDFPACERPQLQSSWAK